MPKIKINELEFYYERHGSNGPPLMLICGLGGHIGGWDLELVEALSSKAQLLLFDNRGAGRSDKPDIEYSIPMLADDAAALLDELGIEKTHVLGASMGGMIAQEFAVRHHEKTISLILCCTAPGGHNMVPPEPWVIQELGRVDGLTPEEIARKNRPLSFTQEFMDNNFEWLEEKMQREILYATPPFSFKRQMMAAMHHDSYESLPQIACPTLVMTGTDDILIPPQNSDIIASQIPGAVLKQYDKKGHAFMTEDRDSVVRDILAQVLDHPL